MANTRAVSRIVPRHRLVWLLVCFTTAFLALGPIANEQPASAQTTAAAMPRIEMGEETICVLPGDRTVQCTGGGFAGPINATSGSVAALSVGIRSACAILTSGVVRCWFESDAVPYSPIDIVGVTGATAIVSGYNQSCAVVGGAVRCWGYLVSGAGIDPTPLPVPGLLSVADLSGGLEQTCARRTDRTVWCWNSVFGVHSPVQVAGLTDATAISLKYLEACAVRTTGTLACWAADGSGATASSPLDEAVLPAFIPRITTAVEVAMGSSHICVLMRDGTTRCWGWNAYGSLGVGFALNTRDAPYPTQVRGLPDATSIAAGAYSTCARSVDGVVRCWGHRPKRGLPPRFPGHPVPLDSVAAAPPPPTNFVVTPGDGWSDVSWTAPNANDYEGTAFLTNSPYAYLVPPGVTKIRLESNLAPSAAHVDTYRTTLRRPDFLVAPDFTRPLRSPVTRIALATAPVGPCRFAPGAAVAMHFAERTNKVGFAIDGCIRAGTTGEFRLLLPFGTSSIGGDPLTVRVDSPLPADRRLRWFMSNEPSHTALNKTIRLCRWDPATAACGPVGVSGTGVEMPLNDDFEYIDTDGDGLADIWEAFGVTRAPLGYLYSGDISSAIPGAVYIPLQEMGADARHRDVFVEANWLASTTGPDRDRLRPDAAQLLEIQKRFAAAPIVNADGTTGINLHIDAGPDSCVMAAATVATCKKWGILSQAGALQTDPSLDADINPANGVTVADIPTLQAISHGPSGATFRSSGRSGPVETLFRFVCFCKALRGTRSPGAVTGVPGDALLVTTDKLGVANPVFATNTFEHLLGHTLGLLHGGDDDVTPKPGYASVMQPSIMLSATTPVGYSMGGTWTDWQAGQAIGQLHFAVPELPKTPTGATLIALTEANLTEYVGVVPERIYDTRNGTGGAANGVRIAANQTVEIAVSGIGATNMGATAKAAAINIGITDPQGAGYATVWPCGATRPNASNINFARNQTTSNLVVAKLGAAGKVCVFSSASTHLFADLQGYHPDTATYTASNPERLLDTRNGTGGVPVGRIASNQEIRLPFPTGATVATLNVAVTDPQAWGWVTVWPCGTPKPNASNINYAAAQTTSNLVITKIGIDNTICLTASTATHLIVDANGSQPIGTTYQGITPQRILDTRSGTRPVANQEIRVHATAPNTPAPNETIAIALNIGVTNPAAAGWITVWPCDTPKPNASNINFAPGQTTANLTITKLSGTGDVCLSPSTTTDVFADINGYQPT
jgi:hypothetical protein